MRTVGLIVIGVLILSGCTPKAALGPVFLYPKVEPIQIELRNFSFQPNHIAILKDSSPPFTFRLKNTDTIKHNFTLVDSHKNVLISVDVTPSKSTAVTIESLDPGNYTFYCNRFLHRCQGMQGMLMVGQYQQ
jgi:plastocyanin